MVKDRCLQRQFGVWAPMASDCDTEMKQLNALKRVVGTLELHDAGHNGVEAVGQGRGHPVIEVSLLTFLTNEHCNYS